MKYYIGEKRLVGSTGKKGKSSGVYYRFSPGRMPGMGVWLVTSDKELATRFGNENAAEAVFKNDGINANIEEVKSVVEKRGSLHVEKFSVALAEKIMARYNEPRMPHLDELASLLAAAIWEAPDYDKCDDDDSDDEEEDED